MSLRVQSVSLNYESRPPPRDNKKLGLLERWASCGRSRLGRHNTNSDHNSHIRMNSDSTASMTSSSSCNSLNILSASSRCKTESFGCIANSKRYRDINTIPDNESSPDHMLVCRETHNISLPSTSSVSADPINIMNWMQNNCPKDVVPLVLAFAGPQKIVTIGRTNRFWRQFIGNETTWRLLCELLYKWKEGDAIPESWKKHYQYNPCVPIDYFSVNTALREGINNAKVDSSKPTRIRVLLRPGRYDLQEAITIDERNVDSDRVDDCNHSVSIAIETMLYSPVIYSNDGHGYSSMTTHQPSDHPKQKLKNSIRNIFRCRTINVETEEDEDYLNHEVLNEYIRNSSTSSAGVPQSEIRGVREGMLFDALSGAQGTHDGRINKITKLSANRASLVLSTRHLNEPLFLIRKGSFTIRNIDLRHASLGNDLWNGNAAIHIQPSAGVTNDSIPTVILDGVDVTSTSGRGIVNIDGGNLKISNSYIHDCAATGIYVGGSGSRATIEQSDVTYNGKGNTKNRRGIAAGHSGIYLEQGHASIIDCNISRNTLTGISAISPNNALLSLQKSDLVCNGTFQLEMPEIGSLAYMNSITVNNYLASSGRGRSRFVFSSDSRFQER